jgi:hypothetical protein
LIDTAVEGIDVLTPVERLFMEAGCTRTHYLFWRVSVLPSIQNMARFVRLASGWPSEAFDDEAEELRLAKGWLEGEARRAAAAREKRALEEKAVESPAYAAPSYGPVMTSGEAQKLIQEEIEAGRAVTLPAFEKALIQASRKVRGNHQALPVQLGGQHKDWQLVELGPESGGHGNGHRLRRRASPHQG